MVDITYEEFLTGMDLLFRVVGWIFSVFGIGGLILVIASYPKGLFSNDVLSFISAFIYSYMAIFGLFLLKFHDEIIVRPE